MTSAVPPKEDHDVAYLTDVEGQWERLASFLRGNPLVWLDEQERIVVKEGVTFVFGGDAIDRGPHGRKIVRTLLDAKKRHPDQVVLLAGNRDLNKLRLVRELAGHPPKRMPDDVRNKSTAEVLKWILANTMGAADAFANRQTELKAEGAEFDDDSVARSYLDDLSQRGELARYLERCQLSWRSGRTLFVHGGVAEEALCVVPGYPTWSLKDFDIDVWMKRLDAFYRKQMAAFAAREIEPDGKPAWEDAILYQAPRKGMKLNPGSVVYGRMGDEHNNPALPAEDVVYALLKAGIQRVVVGHTPSGDVPSIVRTTQTPVPFEAIVADNSRSRVETGSRVVVRDQAVVYRGRCILDDKRALDVDLTLPVDDRATPIGRRTSDGSLVKAPFPDGWLLFRYDPGYQVVQRIVAEQQLGPLVDAVDAAPSAG